MIALKNLVPASLAAVAILTNPATSAAGNPEEGFVYVNMKTNMGDIVLELNEQLAPVSVENFLTYAKKGFYDGTVFHRIMPNFVIQGGGYDTDLNQKTTDSPIKNEWRNGLTNGRGTLSMARTNAPDSATSQFYVNLVKNAALDIARAGRQPDPVNGAAYAVFGRVADGMDVVDAISAVKTTSNPKVPGMPVPEEPVIVESVTVIEGDALDALMETHRSEREAVLVNAAKRREAIQLEVKQGQEARAAAAEKKKMLAAAEQKHAADASRPDEAQFADALSLLHSKFDFKDKDAVKTESGLWYYDIKTGTGQQADPEKNVVAHYTGWFTDGMKFDSSHDHPGGNPARFPLRGVITGWTEGVGGMKVGGRRLLIIPGSLGYGDNGRPPIPANATLVFDVELIEVQ